MSYRRLFILVEGEDDARFFKKILFPLFKKIYQDVTPIQFRGWTGTEIRNLLRSVQAMDADYILVGDLDRHACASAAKEALLRRYPFVDPGRIQIVKAEIESWYCAGIGPDAPELGSLGIATCSETAEVTKEVFDAAIGQERSFRIPTLVAVLERFDLERAIRRNGSLQYFVKKFLGISGP